MANVRMYLKSCEQMLAGCPYFLLQVIDNCLITACHNDAPFLKLIKTEKPLLLQTKSKPNGRKEWNKKAETRVLKFEQARKQTANE